jgi:hypothetical protein
MTMDAKQAERATNAMVFGELAYAYGQTVGLTPHQAIGALCFETSNRDGPPQAVAAAIAFVATTPLSDQMLRDMLESVIAARPFAPGKIKGSA